MITLIYALPVANTRVTRDTTLPLVHDGKSNFQTLIRVNVRLIFNREIFFRNDNGVVRINYFSSKEDF